MTFWNSVVTIIPLWSLSRTPGFQPMWYFGFSILFLPICSFIPAIPSQRQYCLNLSCTAKHDSKIHCFPAVALSFWGRKSSNKKWRGRGEGGGIVPDFMALLAPQVIHKAFLLSFFFSFTETHRNNLDWTTNEFSYLSTNIFPMYKNTEKLWVYSKFLHLSIALYSQYKLSGEESL